MFSIFRREKHSSKLYRKRSSRSSGKAQDRTNKYNKTEAVTPQNDTSLEMVRRQDRTNKFNRNEVFTPLSPTEASPDAVPDVSVSFLSV